MPRPKAKSKLPADTAETKEIWESMMAIGWPQAYLDAGMAVQPDTERALESLVGIEEEDYFAAFVWKCAQDYQVKSNWPGRLFWFCSMIMGFKKIIPRVHDLLLCRKLEACLRTDARYFFEWHRSSFKTTVVSLCWPLWIMGVDPIMEVMIVQSTKEQTAGTLESIILAIENNTKLISIFPGMEKAVFASSKSPVQWSRANGIMIRATLEARIKEGNMGKGFSISTAAVDKSTTGQHPTVVIVDDIETDVNTESDITVEKVKRRFRQIMGPVLQRGCPAVVIGTPWKADDLHADVRSSKRWEHSVVPLRTRERDDDGNYTYSIPRDEIIKQLRPSQRYGTCGFDEQTEQEYIEDMNWSVYDFEAQMMCNPVPPEEMSFPVEGWVEYDLQNKMEPWHFISDTNDGMLDGAHRHSDEVSMDEKLAHFYNRCAIYACIDVAEATTREADYTVIEVWALNRNGNAYLVDCVYDRMQPHRVVEAVFDLFNPPQFEDGKARPRSVYWKDRPFTEEEARFAGGPRIANMKCWRPINIEGQDATWERALFSAVQAEAKRRGVAPPPFIKRTGLNKTSKQDRILKALQPLFERKRFRFPRRMDKKSFFHKKTMDVMALARKEYFHFGNTKRDDFLDALWLMHTVMLPSFYTPRTRNSGIQVMPNADTFSPTESLGLSLMAEGGNPLDAPNFVPGTLIRRSIQTAQFGIAAPYRTGG